MATQLCFRGPPGCVIMGKKEPSKNKLGNHPIMSLPRGKNDFIIILLLYNWVATFVSFPRECFIYIYIIKWPLDCVPPKGNFFFPQIFLL